MNAEALMQLRMASNLLLGASDILGEDDQMDLRRFVIGSIADEVGHLADLWEDQGAHSDGAGGRRMSRYDLPDPKCKHKRKGRVTAGAFDGAHASTSVCDRPECIEDGMAWAWATTHLQPTHIPDGAAQRDGGEA